MARPWWAVLGGAAGLGLATTVAVVGSRRAQRQQLEDLLVEALAPTLGVRHLDRRIVRTTKWSKGWPGQPRIIKIAYAPGAPDHDPEWLPQLLAVTEARLQADYELLSHDRRRCRLRLGLRPPAAEPAAPPRAQIRAERAVTELIGPTSTVTGVELDGEELTSITVSHQAGAKLAAAGYRTRIERTVSTMMPGRWRALWDLEGDTVRFERRPSLPSSVWLPATPIGDTDDLLRNYRDVKIPCAVDEDGREVVWRPAVIPQAMLTGGTGSGKTSMAHALLGQITRYGWPVWVSDAKRVEFLDFRDWPNVQIVAGTIPQQVALIHRAWELMEHRYALIESGQARVSEFEPLVVFLDEYTDFQQNLAEWYAQIKVKGDPARPPSLAEVKSLARKARTARIHLVLSTQRPDAEFMGGEMRDNFGFRISMGRLSPQGAAMMWENPSVGIALPRGCVGRATATHDDGRPVEAQCYRFPDLHADPGSDEAALLEQLRPPERRHPRLVIIPPGPDPETGEDPTFRDYATADWALAESRPDLDPLAASAVANNRDRGREMSSTLSALGLRSGAAATTSPRIPQTIAPPAAAAAHDTDTDTDDTGLLDGEPGYGPAVSCSPRDVQIGDLIEPDPGSGVWAVVDEQPVDDLSDVGLVAISWRGDGDESGSVSIPDDEWVDVRRPLSQEVD